MYVVICLRSCTNGFRTDEAASLVSDRRRHRGVVQELMAAGVEAAAAVIIGEADKFWVDNNKCIKELNLN